MISDDEVAMEKFYDTRADWMRLQGKSRISKTVPANLLFNRADPSSGKVPSVSANRTIHVLKSVTRQYGFDSTSTSGVTDVLHTEGGRLNNSDFCGIHDAWLTDQVRLPVLH